MLYFSWSCLKKYKLGGLNNKTISIVLEAKSQIIAIGPLYGFQITVFSYSHLMGVRESMRERWREGKPLSLFIRTLILP